jgi:NADPH2:quinone reductase
MTKAIRVHQAGGPEVLRWEDVSVGEPGKGQVRVRHSAAGLNYIDVYQRTGLYPMQYPVVLGMEGAGTVTAVGPGVRDLKVGDRIAYTGAVGAYSEERVLPAEKAVKLPQGIDDRTAAAIMLKGTTAEYLLRRTFKVKKGQTILVHAAAGGVGLILCQWAKHLGCTVIGTVGSDDKVKLARAHGCDHPIVYTRENFAKRVREITDGKGVPVVYDAVGKDTWDGSLDCLSPLGMMVSYGNASGPVPPISLLTLSQKGSLYVTRPTSVTYFAKRSDLVKSTNELFKVVQSGAVKIEINQTYPLRETAQAHRDLEARKTTGSTVLVP